MAPYVFRRSGSDWAQEAELRVAGTLSFGWSVSLDGDTLAATDSTGLVTVYVFARLGSAWAQQAVLRPSNGEASDSTGYAALSLSGDTIALGAYREDSAATGIDGDPLDNSAADSGAVYVFRRTGDVWSQEAYLKASNTGARDWFGWSVSLDGSTLAVGAAGEDSRATGVGGDESDNGAADSGAVYVFRRTADVWSQEAYLKASNTDPLDSFGRSVSADGDALAVGAYFESSAARGVNGDQDNNLRTGSGAAYVFRRTADVWMQEAYLKASDTDEGDNLAAGARWRSVAWRHVAVAAFAEASSATGVRLGERRRAKKRRLFPPGGGRGRRSSRRTPRPDEFGWAVSSRRRAAVAALGEDSNATGVNGDQTNAAARSGAVYYRSEGPCRLRSATRESYVSSPCADAVAHGVPLNPSRRAAAATLPRSGECGARRLPRFVEIDPALGRTTRTSPLEASMSALTTGSPAVEAAATAAGRNASRPAGRPLGIGGGAIDGSVSTCRDSSPRNSAFLGARMTARSMAKRSSRTLPGQRPACSLRVAPAVNSRSGLRYRPANCSRNTRARSRTSSPRLRSGGTSMVKAASR